MQRPPFALAALVCCSAFLATGRAQVPAAPAPDEKDFWSAEPRPAKAVPPPIVPEHWLVVPNDSGVSVAQVFGRHLLDTKQTAPTVGGVGLPWKAVDTARPAGVVAAYTRISSERDEVRMARLSGAEYLFVDGDGFVGDVDQRGFRGVPIALRKGDNDIFVLGVPDSFELELWVPQARTVLASWDIAWPGDNPIADDIAFPVFNASLEAAPSLHVHYGHARTEGSNCAVAISDWRCCSGGILPLGVRMGGSYFYGIDECDPTSDEVTTLVPLNVCVSGDSEPDAQVLRCSPTSERKKSRASMPPRNAGVLLGSPLSAMSTDAVLVIPRSDTPARARFDQQICWYRAWFVPDAITAEELVSTEPGRAPESERQANSAWGKKHFVLYGNSDTNAAWQRLVPDTLQIQVRNGWLSVGGKEYTGEDICGWFRCTPPSGKNVVVIASTGPQGARLGYLLQPQFGNCEGLDYCFWNSPGGTAREFASGKFPRAATAPRSR